MPRVTCCMPVYNSERYLAEAIESIVKQTFGDWKLVVASDGSSDRSVEIAKGFQAQDARIEVIDRRENRGVAYTRNEMLERADSEFVASMDADDLSSPQRFERQVQFLDAHPECVLVGSRVLLVDPDGAPLRPMGFPEEHEAIDKRHIQGGSSAAITNPTVMARTAAVKAVGGYREAYSGVEDYDLFLRLAEIGKLHNLQDILLHYRRHLSTIGSQSQRAQRERIVACVREARERRGLPSIELDTFELADSSEWMQYRLWALWALRGGNVQTARKHAVSALRTRPWSPRSWHTMARSLLAREVKPERG